MRDEHRQPSIAGRVERTHLPHDAPVTAKPSLPNRHCQTVTAKPSLPNRHCQNSAHAYECKPENRLEKFTQNNVMMITATLNRTSTLLMCEKRRPKTIRK